MTANSYSEIESQIAIAVNAIGIQSEDYYNMDKTGFRIGVGKDQWSITKVSDRPLYLPSANDWDLITAVECDHDHFEQMALVCHEIRQ